MWSELSAAPRTGPEMLENRCGRNVDAREPDVCDANALALDVIAVVVEQRFEHNRRIQMQFVDCVSERRGADAKVLLRCIHHEAGEM